MSVWTDIDEKQTEYLAEVERIRGSLYKRGARLLLPVDEYGRWWCSWRPTRGDRHAKRVSALNPTELLARLGALVDEWPRKRAPRAKKAS